MPLIDIANTFRRPGVLVSLEKFFSSVAVTAVFCGSLAGQAQPAAGQAQPPAGQAQTPAPGAQPAGAQPADAKPNWKDRAEYDLVESITKETDHTKRIALLNQWKEKYPNTDFKKLRAQIYLQSYQGLNQSANVLAAARDILAVDPQDMQALSTMAYYTPALNNQAPDALAAGEKAARGVLENLETFYTPDKKPAQVTAEQWAKAKKDSAAMAHKTLGWIAMIRKEAAPAEENFQKSLEFNPAQGDVSYWLGQTIMGERNADKYSVGLWHIARAASYDGPGALPPAGRKPVDDYLVKAYKGYHGDVTGLDEIKTQAKASALPPPGFNIESVKDIAIKKLKQEEEFAKNNPQAALWIRLKEALLGAEGQQYFDSSMKDAIAPKLRGTLVEQKPKELLVAMSPGSTTPEVTLQLESPLPKAEPGLAFEFEGVAKSYTKEPFMVVMDVEKEKITGWPAAAPAKKSAPAKRKRGR
jgi:hypothetical protein